MMVALILQNLKQQNVSILDTIEKIKKFENKHQHFFKHCDEITESKLLVNAYLQAELKNNTNLDLGS